MTGSILRYDGVKFSPKASLLEQTKKFESKSDMLEFYFNQIGALAIRLQNGQSQRVNLIRESIDPKYLTNPVEGVGKGHDQSDLFIASESIPVGCPAFSSHRLEKCALATLGKGKFLNEKGQKLVHHNRFELRGEQYLWEKIHASAWFAGINFASELHKQGFKYLCCPSTIGPKEYKLITEALKSKNYSFSESGNEIVVLEYHLPIYPINKFYLDKNSIELDAKQAHTFQDNGLLINSSEENQRSPLGWMIHKDYPAIVPQDLLENCIRIIRLAKGGFHGLSSREQKMLEVWPNNNQQAFTQSPVFNAILAICKYCEREYNFNPERIMGNSIGISFSQVTDFFTNLENVDDFLTGYLLTEMVQPLKVTRAGELRERSIPIKLTYPFEVLKNTSKAIAYAYDLQYKGLPLLDFKSITMSDELPDICINGDLAVPSFTLGKHSSAILATAQLVSEQIFLEKILATAFNENSAEKIEDILNKIIGDFPNSKEVSLKLLERSRLLQKNDGKLTLGLQFRECEEVVSLLRKTLNFDTLIEFIEILEKPDIHTSEALVEFTDKHSVDKLNQALMNLYRLGKIIQETPELSALSEGSNGINVGLTPFIRTFFGDLLKNCHENEDMYQVKHNPIQLEQNQTAYINYISVMLIFILISSLIQFAKKEDSDHINLFK